MEIIQNGSTQLPVPLHAHLGMLLSYTWLTAIFISFLIFYKIHTGIEQTTKKSSIGKIAWALAGKLFIGSHFA